MNESKYLPIGTVCTIENYNKMVMIIGYFSTVYSGNVRMFDYKACDYPEGMLLENKQISFNHSNILNIVHLGFINTNYENFNMNLVKQESNDTNNMTSSSIFDNIKFDSNGVVIYDGTIEKNYDLKGEVEKNNNYIENKDNVSNPFYENYIEEEKSEEKENNWPIFKNIEFDSNGVVISAEEN